MRVRTIAVVLLIALLAMLAACGEGKADTVTTAAPTSESTAATAGPETTAAPALEDVTIAYSSIASGALAIWAGYLETNLRAECDSRGWELKVLSAEGDAELQGEQITQLVNMDPDAFVLFPADPRLAADWVTGIAEAGIPCFMIVQDVPEAAQQYVTAYTGFDQYAMCYDIGKAMIDEYGADAGLKVVCISGVPVQQDYIDREAGFNAAITELSNYEVLATEYAFSSRNDAKTLMENFLSAYGADGIDAVIVYEDDLMMGAVQTLDEAGLTGQIPIYGVAPAMTEAMDAIVAGKVKTDTLMRTADIMSTTTGLIADVLAGKTVTYENTCPLIPVTADNVEQYKDQAEY